MYSPRYTTVQRWHHSSYPSSAGFLALVHPDGNLRSWISHGHCQCLDQVTFTGAHSWPQGKAIDLRTWSFRQDQGSPGLSNPGAGRS